MKPNLRLKRERELRAWSQAKVAEEIGTDPATVSRWERGLSFPYPYFRERLCTLFQKSPEALGLVQGLDEDGTRPSLSGSDYLYEVNTGRSSIHDPAIPLPALLDGALIGRDELLFELRQQLYSEQILPLVAMYGIPGVGKTSAAVHLAHDPHIKEHFYDGVLWVSLGPSPNVLAQLARWGTLLGVDAARLQDRTNVSEWAEAIRFAIGGRRLLFVIDDVWNLADALSFKVGGYNCACLLTTRFPHVALHIAGNNAHAVHELTKDDGVALLERLAPGISACEPQGVYELVSSVGGLPLALTLMGRYLRVQAYNQQPRRIRAAVARLLNTHERLYLNEPYAPLDRHTSLVQGAMFSLQAVIAVSDHLLPAEAQRMLRGLALFPPKPNSFTEEAALAVTAQEIDLLDTLSDAGLLESRGPGRYMLHRTISDYARMQGKDPEASQRFVSYFVSLIEIHERNYELLELEASNILSALRMAYNQQIRPALERGIIAFSVFLEASRDPQANEVRSWLTLTE
jgi:transcriptional regulator with XRE-family HTH domain